jgi:hypothetical protein
MFTLLKKIESLIYLNVKILTILWALIILSLCAIPGQYIPSTSWFELVSFDKWVHASIFFILTSLCIVFIFKTNKKVLYIFIAALLCILYGGSIELMQAKLFSHRSADVYDFIANSFGCLVAVGFYKKINKRIETFR